MEEIEFDDLYWAFLCCDSNKKNTDSAIRFNPFHARQIWKLIDEIQKRKYKLSPFRAFIVDYPTLREVFCAAYRDRVVTWFVVNELGPQIEKNLVYDNSNCRKGKGTDFAIKRVQRFIRSESENYKYDVYALKIDMSGFFMSINRQLLLQMLYDLIDTRYRGKYPETLKYLCSILVLTDVTKNCIFCCDKRKWENLPKRKTLFGNENGLPIGSLSSQIFSNLYLSFLDHFIKHYLKVEKYNRYVDDLIIINKDRNKLEQWYKKITAFMESYNLKPSFGKCSIRNCSEGVSYLGKIIYPHYTVPQKRYRKRVVNSVKTYETPRKAYNSLASRKGTFKRYHGYNLGRYVYNALPEDFKRHISYSDKRYFIWNNKRMTLSEILNYNKDFTPEEYAKAVFLWTYSFHAMPILCEKDYRKYFKEECGIKNALDFHIMLIREGYFRKLSVLESLYYLSFSSLKALCERYKPEVAINNKMEAVNYIQMKASQVELNAIIIPDYYVITKKGRNYIEKHQEMILVHKNVKQKQMVS